MDWNLLGLSFVVVFLAELGDKSHFAAISLSGSCNHPRAIFLGTAAALIMASLLGVLLGQGVAELLPANMIEAIAAVGFAIMGVSFLWPQKETNPEID